MRDRLVALIAARAHVEPSELEDDTPLLSSGLVDSLLAIDLVREIERAAGIRIPPEDVSQEHLDTLGRILAYVAKRAKH